MATKRKVEIPIEKKQEISTTKKQHIENEVQLLIGYEQLDPSLFYEITKYIINYSLQTFAKKSKLPFESVFYNQLHFYAKQKFNEAQSNQYWFYIYLSVENMFKNLWSMIHSVTENNHFQNWKITNPYINQNLNVITIDYSTTTAVGRSTQYLVQLKNLNPFQFERHEIMTYLVSIQHPKFWKDFKMDEIFSFFENNEEFIIESKPFQFFDTLTDSFTSSSSEFKLHKYPKMIHLCIAYNIYCFLLTSDPKRLHSICECIFHLEKIVLPHNKAENSGLIAPNLQAYIIDGFIIPLVYWCCDTNELVYSKTKVEKILSFVSRLFLYLKTGTLVKNNKKILKQKLMTCSSIEDFENQIPEFNLILQLRNDTHCLIQKNFSQLFAFWFCNKSIANGDFQLEKESSSMFYNMLQLQESNLLLSSYLELIKNFFCSKSAIDENFKSNFGSGASTYFWKPWLFKNFFDNLSDTDCKRIFHKDLFKSSENFQLFHFEIRKYFNHIPTIPSSILTWNRYYDDFFFSVDNGQWIFPIPNPKETNKLTHNTPNTYSYQLKYWYHTIASKNNSILYQFLAYHLSTFIKHLEPNEILYLLKADLKIDNANENNYQLLLLIFEQCIHQVLFKQKNLPIGDNFLFEFILLFDINNINQKFYRKLLCQIILKTLPILTFSVNLYQKTLERLASSSFPIFLVCIQVFFYDIQCIEEINTFFQHLIKEEIINKNSFLQLEKSWIKFDVHQGFISLLNDHVKMGLLNLEIDFMSETILTYTKNTSFHFHQCLDFLMRTDHLTTNTFYNQLWIRYIGKIIHSLASSFLQKKLCTTTDIINTVELMKEKTILKFLRNIHTLVKNLYDKRQVKPFLQSFINNFTIMKPSTLNETNIGLYEIFNMQVKNTLQIAIKNLL